MSVPSQLAESLGKARRILGLPACVGAHGGELRILVGLMALHPRLRSLPIPFFVGAREAYTKQPTINRDPIGALLAVRPLKNPAAFFHEWEKNRFAPVCSSENWIRSTFYLLGRQQLLLTLRTYRYHRNELKYLKGDQTKQRFSQVRTVIFDVFRDHRRILEADELDENSPIGLQEQARKIIIDRHRLKGYSGSPFSRLEINSISTDIMGPQNPLSILSRVGKISASRVQSALDLCDYYMADAERNDVEEKQFRLHPNRSAHESRGCSFLWTQGQTNSYPIPITPASVPSLAEVIILLEEIGKLDRDIDALILLCLCGLLRPNQLFNYFPKVLDASWCVIEVPAPSFHLPPKAGTQLYRPTRRKMHRLVPSKIGECFRVYKDALYAERRENSDQRELLLDEWKVVIAEREKRTANLRVKEILPTTSLSQALQALRYHASSWWNVHHVWAESSFLRITELKALRFPAQMAYTWCGPSAISSSTPICEIAVPKISPPPVNVHWGFGARYCPKDEVMQKLTGRLLELLNDEPHKSIEKAAHRWNAIAACTHAIALCLSGMRNYPMATVFPRVLPVSRTLIILQKRRPSVIYVPDLLLSLFQIVHDHWVKLRANWQALGVAENYLTDDFCVYRFYNVHSITNCGMWHTIEISHKAIVTGFLGDPILKSISAIHPNSFRHYTNSMLRDCAHFHEVEIQLFHHHANTLLDSLRQHRLELITQKKTLEAMASYIGNLIGLRIP